MRAPSLLQDVAENHRRRATFSCRPPGTFHANSATIVAEGLHRRQLRKRGIGDRAGMVGKADSADCRLQLAICLRINCSWIEAISPIQASSFGRPLCSLWG